MGQQLQENWLLAVIAVVALLWWLIAASRRTRVEIARREDEDTPAKRNQALIDAPPAVSSATPVTIPPVMSGAVGGVGEAIEAAATPAAPAPADGGDDLTRIKGLGPKLAEQLRALGVTRYEQIAGWDDAEINRIDAQLGRFQGRIRRDDWVAQARLLNAGDETAYESIFGKL